ncbi:hypothetical protein OMK64_10145 [Cellulomonas fimi]|uniref:hypothetical protein n=1 Tax=Cellulomonas fimi TaxID=1708 RepID=UPI00234C0BC0|nr:hypothetical protein [Cellulomonas fimi]MDC7121895.1 hypothetical protein [Cellulomonas fimi]
MRLGEYAVVDGRTYRARFGTQGLDLVVDEPATATPEVRYDERYGWWREVGWSVVEEAYRIEVWARAPGRWVVEVDALDDDGEHASVTHFDHWQDRAPFDRGDEPPGRPPYLDYQYYNGYAQGTVPIGDLTDVREVRRDVALPDRSAER